MSHSQPDGEIIITGTVLCSCSHAPCCSSPVQRRYISVVGVCRQRMQWDVSWPPPDDRTEVQRRRGREEERERGERENGSGKLTSGKYTNEPTFKFKLWKSFHFYSSIVLCVSLYFEVCPLARPGQHGLSDVHSCANNWNWLGHFIATINLIWVSVQCWL